MATGEFLNALASIVRMILSGLEGIIVQVSGTIKGILLLVM